MAHRTMTLAFPDEIYDQLRRRAEQSHRGVEDEALRLMEGALSTAPCLPDDLAALLAALTLLDSAHLHQLAQRAPAAEDATILAALRDKRQMSGLTPDEERLILDLIQRYDRAVLVRAKALAVLHERGEDIRTLVGAA